MKLLEASLQFPTVVFSIGLAICLFYWLFVLLGALDIDLLGGGEVSDVSGAAKGVGDMLIGAKGGAEAFHGGEAGAGDGDGGHGDADGDGVWSAVGLGVVPLTISVSIIFLVGWCGSLLAMSYGASLGGWVPIAVLPVILIIAILVTGVLVRPLAPVFRVQEGKSNKDYIGHLCTVTTGRVDDGFGQATLEDGGTVLVIPVRCDRSEVLARGHKALIIDFDPAREAYVIEPTTDMLAEPEPATDDRR